jgi:hypothetical protein
MTSKDCGYFCWSFVKAGMLSNIAVRSICEAEMELVHMIISGAIMAYAIRHGRSDHEWELVALCSTNGNKAREVDLRRYLHERDGVEYERWKAAFNADDRLLDDRWKVVALSADGIHEYGAVGKAVPVEGHPALIASGPSETRTEVCGEFRG